MSGIKNLSTLLSKMSPTLRSEVYVYCTFSNAKYGDYSEYNPIATYQEDEGLTLVITEKMAQEHDVAYESTLKAITLKVHSSLEAVGLTAAVSAKLSHKNISANVIAGYFHDHIFVQSNRAEEAMEALQELSNS